MISDVKTTSIYGTLAAANIGEHFILNAGKLMTYSLRPMSPQLSLGEPLAQARNPLKRSFFGAIQVISLGMLLPQVCAAAPMNSSISHKGRSALLDNARDQLEGIVLSFGFAYISLYEYQSLASHLLHGISASEVRSQPHEQTYIPNLAKVVTASYFPMIGVGASHALIASLHSTAFGGSANRADARQYAAFGTGIVGSLALLCMLAPLKNAHLNTSSTQAQQKFQIWLHTLNILHKPIGRFLGPPVGALLIQHNQTFTDTLKLTGLAYLAMGPVSLLIDHLECALHQCVEKGLEAYRAPLRSNTASQSVASDRIKDKLTRMAQLAGVESQDLEILLPPALTHIAVCPLSLQIMTDPVVLARQDIAHIFERSCARTWIQQRGTHPLDPSFAVARNTVLPSLKSLQSQIEHWLDQELADRTNAISP